MIFPASPLPRRLSFSAKVFLTLAGILFGFALVSGLVFGFIQRQGLKEQLRSHGGLMATMLSGSLQQGLFFEDRAKIDQAVQTLLTMQPHEDLRAVTAYDANDGVVLRRIVAYQDSSASDGLIAPMATALASCRHNRHEGTVWENRDLMIFTVPVVVVADQRSKESLYFDTSGETRQPHTLIGHAQLTMGKQNFDRESRRIAFQTTLLAMLFLLLAMGCSYLLTKNTLVPLQRLISTIRERGGLEAEAVPAADLLGDAFSRMLDELSHSFTTIQTLKDGLEETVATRTNELRRALAELQESHMQLAHSEKMVAIGRLVAGVAHEINNTTNFVSGAMPPLRKRIVQLEELLATTEDTQPDPERCAAIFKSIATLMNNIDEGARRTSKIVGDLKNFSRPADEEHAPVDINQCLRTTCALAYPEYKYRIDLTMELDDALPLVDGAQGQLNQVFMNLLLNAVQAQPEQGTILLSTWLAADGVHVLFSDSGPGIPETVLNRIFEPFFTTKAVGEGTGLGLSISYGIIKKHQGTILARSELGRGAEFEIILPPIQRNGSSEDGETQ